MPLQPHVVTGTGDTTVYLFHGIYGGKEYWRFVTERLVAQGYRVIAWDAPGYGSSPLPDPFSFYVVAEAAAELVRATASKRNILFGHSMGGQITPRILMKLGDMVSAAIITATIGYFGNRTAAEQEEFVRTRTAPPPANLAPEEAIKLVVNSMFGAGASGEEVELVRQVAARTPPKTVKAAVAAIQAYTTAEAVEAIKAISVPTLLVAGEVDQTGHVPGMRRVADMISGSTFGVVPRSGHYPWAECPAEFNQILTAFLQRL